MTTTTNDQLAALARELVAAATEKQIPLCVLGGVAVYMTCPGVETHPSLQRPVKDLDLVAGSKDFEALGALFVEHGLSLQSKDKVAWTFGKNGLEVELTIPEYREDHRIDLGPRLTLASPTLPLADLFLIKLQRVKFVEKDIQDSIALLLDHRVAKGEAEDQIDHEYIAKLCARDWGLFSTVYENTVILEKILDKYLEPEEAQLVWRRIELIQGDMDEQPKSLGWMLQQLIKRPSQVPA